MISVLVIFGIWALQYREMHSTLFCTTYGSVRLRLPALLLPPLLSPHSVQEVHSLHLLSAGLRLRLRTGLSTWP